MFRPLKYIVIHSTETCPEIEADVFARAMKQQGRPAFHSLVDSVGNYSRLLGCNVPAENAMPDNEHCYHIAYIGGLNVRGIESDTRTPIQSHVLYEKLMNLKNIFPDAEIIGNSPGFGVAAWLEFQKDNSEEWIEMETEENEEEQEWALAG